jgi:hypothetical protein
MKYIVVRHRIAGTSTVQDLPFIFPLDIVHLKMFEQMNSLLGKDAHVIAAGEVQFSVKAPFCFGHSSSLDASSRGTKDAELMYFHDCTHGLE